MPWPQTGATHYHAQLRLQDKGRAIFACSKAIIYYLWDGLWTSARGVGLVSCCGPYGHQVSQHPKDT